jgi:hypothetical protein
MRGGFYDDGPRRVEGQREEDELREERDGWGKKGKRQR